MATTSFFYGGSPGQDQVTVNELVADLEAKVALAEAARIATEGAATATAANAEAAQEAAISANSAAGSIDTIRDETVIAAAEADTARDEAVAAAALVAASTAVISSFTVSTGSPTGGAEGAVWFKVTA
jgi:hypothetical protein